MKFVVYEIWTRARLVEAEATEIHGVYEQTAPAPVEGMHLCNWHVVPIPLDVMSPMPGMTGVPKNVQEIERTRESDNGAEASAGVRAPVGEGGDSTGPEPAAAGHVDVGDH